MKHIKAILIVICWFLVMSFSPVYYREFCLFFHVTGDEGFGIFMALFLLNCCSTFGAVFAVTAVYKEIK